MFGYGGDGVARWAIVADVHGNLPALEAVIVAISRRSIDRVINLGDQVSGPLWPSETATLLMRQDWLHLAGNHDRQLTRTDPARQGASDRYAYGRLTPAHLAWLAGLPPRSRPTPDVLAFHGSPGSDLVYLLETVEKGMVRLATEGEIKARLQGESAPLMLCGHTHQPRAVALAEVGLVVNPGSVGLPAYADDTPEPHVMELGSPHARYAIVETDGGSGWRAEFHLIAYDHVAAARQASRNDRPDWAAALATGRMPA